MSEYITSIETLTPDEAKAIISATEYDFETPLSLSLNIDAMSAKWASHAKFLLVRKGTELAAVLVFYENVQGRFLYVPHFVVRTPYQKKGIGHQCIESLTRAYSKDEYENVLLEVQKTNTGAFAFYQREGFMIQEDRPHTYLLAKKCKREQPPMQDMNTVAIQCAVYNHEPYLRDCLEGFVMQKTNFRYVAIVHDDYSTDGSAAIIREYAEKYPDIIHSIFEVENQYSKQDGSLDKLLQEAISQTKAKYVAFCEGDDYWTDPLKLQRQVDFLESHPEHVAIAENGMEVNSVIHKDFPFNSDPSHDVELEEIILKRRFPTAGVLCRRESMDGFHETCRVSVDTILWCWLVSKGKFRYENTISSVYRRGAQGMTEYTEPYQLAKKTEVWNKEILRVFVVQKRFIYVHIAGSFYGCAKAAVKKWHFISAVKCLFVCFIYMLKSLFVK